MNARSPRPNHLIDYLPAIYQEDEFIGKFILGFEKILLGIDDKVSWPESKDKVKFQGLEETITTISALFDPIGDESRQPTPKDFLNWLAGWVALSLRDDWEEEAQRRFISRIVSLYQYRGTKQGMIEMLKTYTGMGVEVYELVKPLQIGVTSTVGVDTAIGGGPPHYFRVKMFVNDFDPQVNAFDPQVRERKKQTARAIIEQEKPSHTYYELLVETPTMRIEVHSTVGVNTLLGTPRN
ncbi:phage tail protein [Calothrix sp. NIES-4071]|nr:phage tail protein [Calothrix sp. NIES-4071]BAZ54902.1 phage tail protein [Calothrix sp. NIES-4105]